MRTSSGINQSEHVDRARRVAEFVQREVSELIKTEFDDPRFDLVTVTDVRVSKDLKHARVFVSKADLIVGLQSGGSSGDRKASPHSAEHRREHRRGKGRGDSKADGASVHNNTVGGRGDKSGESKAEPDYVNALNRASARIRRLLAQRMTTKNTPRLQFEFDRVLDQGHRISSILDAVSADPSTDPAAEPAS